MANHIELPVAFCEPVQLILFTRYGDPRVLGWEQRWLTNWFLQESFPWFPQRSIYIHKHFKTLLESAFREIEVMDLQDEINSIQKCHAKKKDAKGLLSAHSWGAALDMRPKKYFQHASWSDDFIDIMRENGIWCGQHKNDFHHAHRFSLVEG